MADAKTTALTELTTVALADIMPIVDDVGGSPETKKVTVENLLEAINAATAEASIDGAADFLLIYDTSATGVRKVLPDNLPVPNHAASKITSGTLAHERGGLEADVSAYDGLLRITGGATSAVTVTSFALTVLDDADAATVRATIGAASSAEVSAITSGYSRRQGVIARVDNTAAPPTEVSGDRYLLDATGASHADWDGAAANDIVEFDGSSWVATSPTEGWIVYSDGSDTDWLYVDDGSPEWTERTAGGGVTDHGALTGLTDDDHSIYSLADGTRWTTTQTADRAVMTDGSGNLVVSTVTATELGYVSGVTSAIQTQIDGKAASSHSHAASDITSGTLVHERGGLEADISGIAVGDIIAGTGSGTLGLVTATGHSDGDVLTIQADGTVDFETPAGSTGGLTVTKKTSGYTAAAGDLVVCDATGGAFNVTFPASPSADQRIGVYVEHATSSLQVTVQGNGKTLAEYGSAVTMQTPGDLLVFQYDGVKWVVTANGLQTFSLDLLTAANIDEDADMVRLHDGSATEDFEKRATVKSMLAPYIEDSTLGTDAGDIVYRPTANDHWTNLKIGSNGKFLTSESGLPVWGAAPASYFDQLVAFPTANYWHTSPVIPQTTFPTFAVAQNKLYAVPLIVSRSTAFQALGCYIASTGTATWLRLGIYESADGMPTDLVTDAETAANVTGNREPTISETIEPGLYFLAIVANGSVNLQGIPSGNLLWNYGHNSPQHDSDLHLLRGDHTYAAMPATFPSIDIVSGDIPRLLIQK